MSMLDDLLKLDKDTLANVETVEIEIERFSKLTGKPCLFKIRGLTNKQVKELQELNTKEVWENVMWGGKTGKKKTEKVDTYKLALDMIVESVVEPDFRDGRLREKFKTENPAEIVEEMLTPGEIQKIATAISDLMGVNVNEQAKVDEEIKNL